MYEQGAADAAAEKQCERAGFGGGCGSGAELPDSTQIETTHAGKGCPRTAELNTVRVDHLVDVVAARLERVRPDRNARCRAGQKTGVIDDRVQGGIENREKLVL